MKILFFLPTYTLTIERGDTTHVNELVSNLSKLAETTVIKANVASASDRVHFMTKTLRVIRGFIRAISLIRKNRPDIVYTRDSQCIFTLPLAKLFGLPLIVEINGLSLNESRMEGELSGINGWISDIKGIFNEKTYRYADHLIVVNNEIKNVLEIEYKISLKNISVIENGANTELFKPMNAEKARRELKLDETYYYICYLGSLFKRQGVEYLIKASPYILEKYPNTYFLIVGDGPTRNLLTELAEQLGVLDKFVFTGAKPYNNVPLYINASDLCVAPFISWDGDIRIAGSPLKVYEYLACGKPFVASDIEGMRYIVAVSNSGVCVPAENPQELASAVVDLLRDPEARRIMGENGRRYILDNGSWESVAGKVFKVCQKVVQKHLGERETSQ
jgi:glycosyltransferase involved in cell wall biosynthesis